MKYFKFKQVCSQSGVSVGIRPPCAAGPWWPEIAGLEIILIGGLYGWCYGTASDEAEPNDDNFVLEITEARMLEVLNTHYSAEKTRKLEEIDADYVNTKAQLIAAGENEAFVTTTLDTINAAVKAVVNNYSVSPIETSHIRWQESEDLTEANEFDMKETVLKHNSNFYQRYQAAKNT